MDLSEVDLFEQQVRPLRLSEAIRIGAKLRPKANGSPFHGGASCAIGAAAEALGMPYNAWLMGTEAATFVAEKLGIVGMLDDRSGDGPDGLYGRIWRRNDHCGQSRESIADWLEGLGY